MVDESFIWEPWPIESVDDIIRFEDKYRELTKNTPDEWSPETGLVPHGFGDGNLCLLTRGHFKMMANGCLAKPGDVFIEAGCNKCESLVLHSFIGFESGLYRRDSYYNHIPPFVNNICQILDNALNKLPLNDNEILFRACVFEDRENFVKGELFLPGYSLTTTADKSWRDNSSNRFVITPLPTKLTRARAIYKIKNKAQEYQVSFISDAKFLINDIEKSASGKMIVFMEEMR